MRHRRSHGGVSHSGSHQALVDSHQEKMVSQTAPTNLQHRRTETLNENMVALRTWNRKFLDWLGHPLPDDYLAFDCETQGLKRDWALPVDIGHCVVRGRESRNQGNFVVNWYGYPGVDDEWFTYTLEKTYKAMREQGKEYRYTPEFVRKHGKDPTKVLKFYYDLFKLNRHQGAKFVGHNAWFFDSELLQNVLDEAAGLIWQFDENELYDTGAMEKAFRGELEPFPDEHTLKQYFLRVHHAFKPGVKWNIEICMERYDILQRFELDWRKIHGAGEDAYVSHLLFEEHRSIE